MDNIFEQMQASAERLAQSQSVYEKALAQYDEQREALDQRRTQIREERKAAIEDLREQQKQQMADLRAQMDTAEEEALREPQETLAIAAEEHNAALDAWKTQLDSELATKIFTHPHLDAMGLGRPSAHRPVKVTHAEGPAEGVLEGDDTAFEGTYDGYAA